MLFLSAVSALLLVATALVDMTLALVQRTHYQEIVPWCLLLASSIVWVATVAQLLSELGEVRKRYKLRKARKDGE